MSTLRTTTTSSKSRLVRGVSVPAFFYGTAWKEERTQELVELALQSGFRGIDTANQRRHYFEAAVGEAVATVLHRGELERGDLFLQTKFTYPPSHDHRIPYDTDADYATQVEQSFSSSLEHLQTDYVDSYVLHGPSMPMSLSPVDVEVWRAMEGLQRAGRAKLIGVSNVSADQLSELLDVASIAPAFVQNRCFARLEWDGEVRQICRAHDVVYQGFSLLTANRRELSLPQIRQIADRLGKTVPQVIFGFSIQSGMLPLTGTSSSTHMQEDLDSFDVVLTREEMDIIERA